MSKISKLLVGGHGLLIDWLVVESAESWSDAVLLSHLEVLSQVLISAPPVEMDHAESLVPSVLMEVGVSNVVLLSIGWESEFSVWSIVHPGDLTDAVEELALHHFLLGLGVESNHEGHVHVIEHDGVQDSESVLGNEIRQLPESVSVWVLGEPSNVFVSSPLLGHVSWLSGLGDEFGEVTVSLLGEGSKR